MSSKSKRGSKKRRVIPKAASAKGREWSEDIKKVVRIYYEDLYKNGPPSNDSANYAVPVHWTKTGVAMWNAFVMATSEGKEAAVATSLLTGFLQKTGWMDLCKRIEHEIRSKQIMEEQAAAELVQAKRQLLNDGVLVEGRNAQEAVGIEDAPQEEEERPSETGEGSGSVERAEVAMGEG